MARFGRRGGSSGAGAEKGSSQARKVPFTATILTALAALCIPLWILAFLGWAVQLAGVSAVQYKQGRHFLQVRIAAVQSRLFWPGVSTG